MKRSTFLVNLALIATSFATSVAFSLQSAQAEGFMTKRQPQLRALQTGVEVKPILTVGDKLDDGYQMAAIPDGLGSFDNYNGTFTVFMNHELSSDENLSDARVSKLTIDKANLNVLKGEYVIKGTEGYKRFCAASLATRKDGFSVPTFLTNEESTDGKFGGISVAINGKTNKKYNLPWVGRMSHETTLAVPGYNKIVLVTTEDDAPGRVYMYIAASEAALYAGKGQLYVFKADGATSPADFGKGKNLTGRFIPIKASENKDAATLRATVDAKGAMFFSRVEDVDHDVKSPRTLYFASTGRPSFVDPATGKPYDSKGRLHKMILGAQDPTRVVSLQVMLDGDAGDPIISPDNIGVSDRSIMIQEDLNSEFRGQRNARIWRYDLRTNGLSAVATMDQKDFQNRNIPGDKLGTWESSGIFNMANILGPNTWLLTVQAHSQSVAQFGGKDEGGQLVLMTVPDSAAQLAKPRK
jgi:hypothetical protein